MLKRSLPRIRKVVIEREGDGYLCPELDIASQGNTIEEASPAEITERFHREVYVTHLDVAVG